MCTHPIQVIVVSGEHGPTVQMAAADDADPVRVEWVADLAVERWKRANSWWLAGLHVTANEAGPGN